MLKSFRDQKKKLIFWLKKNKAEALILIFILGVAAFLRLYRIADYMTFLGDEGRDVLVVKQIIVDHKFTLLGPTASVGGFFLGPIYYYFMIPFLLIFNLNPVGPAVMVALFGVAAVFLVYQVGKSFFNPATGLLAASLYALSPLVIAYSRSSWNPNLVPFFALLYIFSLDKIVKTSSRRWWFFSGLMIGIGLQLHYLFTFLIIVGIAFLLFSKKGSTFLRNWVVKGLGLIIGWSPFIAFELRHGFTNFKTLFRFILHGQETGFVTTGLLDKLGNIIFRLYGRLVFYFPPPEQYYRYGKTLLLSWRLFVVLALVSSLAVLIIQILKIKKESLILTLFWLIFGSGLFIFYQKEIYDYYLGIMFPLPFLLIGNLVSSFWPRKTLRPLLVLFFVGLVWINWFGQPFKFPPNRQLDQAQKIAKIVFENSGGQPFNFALITNQNSDHAYRYFLELWGNSPITIENPQIDPERKSVTNQLLIVCETTECHPLGHSLWEIAGFGRAQIAGEWSAPAGIKVMKLIHWREG